MEKENLFIDVPKEQRSAMLAEISDKQEMQKVQRPYTHDEKMQMKDHVVEESISIKDVKKEMKAVVKEFNDALKKHADSVSHALDNIKKGYSENEETVYMIADQDAGEMNIYDANGVYLSTRKLRPDEKQTKVYKMNTGTNG